MGRRRRRICDGEKNFLRLRARWHGIRVTVGATRIPDADAEAKQKLVILPSGRIGNYGMHARQGSRGLAGGLPGWLRESGRETSDGMAGTLASRRKANARTNGHK